MAKSKVKGSFGRFLTYQARTSNTMMKGTAEASLKGMLVSIVRYTPRKTGKLQRSMKKSKVRRRADGVQGWEGDVYTKLHYAWVVNSGRRKREVFAKPGNFFSVGNRKVTHYTQSAMIGRRMFERGAFEFSTVYAEDLMKLRYEEWNREAKLKTRQGV